MLLHWTVCNLSSGTDAKSTWTTTGPLAYGSVLIIGQGSWLRAGVQYICLCGGRDARGSFVRSDASLRFNFFVCNMKRVGREWLNWQKSRTWSSPPPTNTCKTRQDVQRFSQNVCRMWQRASDFWHGKESRVAGQDRWRRERERGTGTGSVPLGASCGRRKLLQPGSALTGGTEGGLASEESATTSLQKEKWTVMALSAPAWDARCRWGLRAEWSSGFGGQTQGENWAGCAGDSLRGLEPDASQSAERACGGLRAGRGGTPRGASSPACHQAMGHSEGSRECWPATAPAHPRKGQMGAQPGERGRRHPNSKQSLGQKILKPHKLHRSAFHDNGR